MLVDVKPFKMSLLFFWAALIAPIFQPAFADGLSQEAKTNFEWFSGLGFPDVKGCPLVRVATGWWSQSGDEPAQNQYTDAFLLGTNPVGITVLTMDLTKHTFDYRTNGTPGYALIGFQPLNLKEVVNAVLIVHTNESEEAQVWRRFGESISERVEFFVLAWGCWRNGLDSEAEQLYLSAKTKHRVNERVAEPDFQIQLEKDISYALTWRATLNFGEPSVSRGQLLSEFQNIASNYPHGQYQDRAEQTVGILKRMVAEDDAHAKNGPTNLDVLPVDQRVRELIFQLREQNGQQWSQPGECDIFMDRRGTNSPAGKLVAFGYPAVPQLIDALNDPTFTRSVGFWRNFTFSHTVLTVGDCAVAILQRITGKRFYRPASTSGYMSNENKNGDVRKAVEAWWAEFQKKGEKEILIEGTEAGDDSSPAQGTLLIERYPDAALAPLIKGTRAATNTWTKGDLIGLFDKVYSADAESFLEQELNAGGNEPYVAAARILNHHGNSQAIPAMIHRWESTTNTAVIGFLANVDSPQAIAALGKDFQSRPMEVRMQVVKSMGDEEPWYYYYITNRSAATRDAREEFLVTALQDTGQEIGENGSRMGKNYQDPRVCDMAGFFLNQSWSNRYDFDLSASLLVRDRQRVECQNVWRQAHQLPLLTLPMRTNRVAENEAVKVTTIEWDAATVKPSEEFAARVEAFKGKLLAATNCTALLADYAAAPEAGSAGLLFSARKDEDLSGVKLSFCLLPGPPPRQNKSCHVAEGVVLGRRGLLGSGGVGDWSFYAHDDRAWEDLTSAIAKAIAGPPKAPFIINVKMGPE